MKYCNAFIIRQFNNRGSRVRKKSPINAFRLMAQLTIGINQKVRVFKTVEIGVNQSHKCKSREYFCWEWRGWDSQIELVRVKWNYGKLNAPTNFRVMRI